jgi:hypothetical protein
MQRLLHHDRNVVHREESLPRARARAEPKTRGLRGPEERGRLRKLWGRPSRSGLRMVQRRLACTRVRSDRRVRWAHYTARPARARPARARPARARARARPDARGEGLRPGPNRRRQAAIQQEVVPPRRLDRSLLLLPAGRRGRGRRWLWRLPPEGSFLRDGRRACARARCPGLCERDGARRLPCDGAMRMARGRRGHLGLRPARPAAVPSGLRERVGTGRMPGDAPVRVLRRRGHRRLRSSNDVLGASAAGGIPAGTARRAGGRPGWLAPAAAAASAACGSRGPPRRCDARRGRQGGPEGVCSHTIGDGVRVRPAALGAGGTMQL